MMFPSACIWNSGMSTSEVLRRVKETAFHYVDLEPEQVAAPEDLGALNSLGLKVSCVALDHHLPDGSSLGAADESARRKAMERVTAGIAKAAELGAPCAYVSPCKAAKQLGAFRAAVTQLAELAAAKGIRLCIEHTPGSALPTARAALEFIDGVQNTNVYLLLDVGHALISKEAPWEGVTGAGSRLGYVQFNDNDGRRDRHWALLDGKLTYPDISRIIEALRQVAYMGTLGIELARTQTGLMSDLSRARNLLLRAQLAETPRSILEPEARRKH